MLNAVKGFKELTSEEQSFAGGKGGMLAKMYQMGYPVPEGFVILPSAFQEEKVTDSAWKEIQAYINSIRRSYNGALFAIRSSALSEDSAQASFAGEFETVLNVRTDEAILEAIYEVYNSRQSERVKVYSSLKGIEDNHQIAIVIQIMVASELSGVLFTADPITGSYSNMIGNYVHGLGEQLVSGEATGYDFKLIRPKGKYDGPEELKQYARELFKNAEGLEKDLGGPQDIEWAVAEGKLYLLQARPVTTVSAGNLETYEINESLAGDSLWVNTNVGEAIPDVVTPLTWSLVRAFDLESSSIPGYYLWSGNICGRIYSNISHRLSAVTILYGKSDFAMKLLGEIFGQLPENLSIPIYPFTRLGLIKGLLPRIKHYGGNLIDASRNMSRFTDMTPEWCRGIDDKIRAARGKEELLILWKQELEPYNYKGWWSLLAGGTKAALALSLNKKLTELIGTEDANALLSNLRGNTELASLGPVVGISKVIKGEMSRQEYLQRYGHRGPHEFELSIPGPSEDKSWLESQIREFEKSDTDVALLLKKQHHNYEDALNRFRERQPGKLKWLEKKMAKAAAGAREREAARSEFVRVFRVNRTFAIKAGEITGVGEDVFFLYINELLQLLSGENAALKYIPARKENYRKYQELPPFPSVIRGRFNPYEWLKDENKRMDFYDSTMPAVVATDGEMLKGFAGAAGRVEGLVRILVNPEEGEKLQPGEILVATTTNVGWTPLFPRAGAVITDVGAPLSHAAIVARELGIPAVVGCGNATLRLKTGDRVMVDGGQGIVHILK